MERTAQKGHVAVDGTPAGKAGYGLRHHRLEDRRGDVLLLGALVEQGLHVGLGKNAAARCDGINDRVVFGQLVEAAGVGIQKACHLIDKRAGTASAGAVHTLLYATVKVDNLGVLSAKLYGHVCLRNERLYSVLVGDDLLDEGNLEPTGQKQAAAAGNGHSRRSIAHLLQGLGHDLYDRRAHIGVMAPIDAVDHVVACVQRKKFDRGRADVDAYAEHIVRSCSHVISILQGAVGHKAL